MNEYHKKLEAESAGKAYQIPAEKRHDDFVSFVNDVWFPLQVMDGKHMRKNEFEVDRAVNFHHFFLLLK